MRPRKSPTQKRARETVEAILTATAHILVTEGFEGASTNRIAEEAGVSIGSLYQYFPNKESLVAVLIERHVREMFATVEGALARWQSLPLRTVVREMVETMIRAHAVEPRLHRVLVEQVPRIGRFDRIMEVEERWAELARAYLERHRDEVRPRNLEVAAFIVVQAIEALTRAAVLYHPEKLRSSEFIDEVAELVARYLSADA